MSGFQKRMRINLLMMLILIGYWVSRAISYSCSVSRSTVQAVDDCPDSEEKWKEAAARKNCGAYASQCDEPKSLMYHCVINAFVNQTLEVCAYRRIIVSGYCTEYNIGGNIIQQSFRTNCTQFTKNPCPLGYQSTDAYKYPGCYELTKRITAKTTLSTTNATHMNNDKQVDGGSSTDIILPVILVVVLVLIVVVLVGIYLILIRRKEKCSFFRKKDPKNIYETETEESLSLRVPCDTETEDIHIAPSGQIIGNERNQNKKNKDC